MSAWEGLVVDWEAEHLTKREREAAERQVRREGYALERKAQVVELAGRQPIFTKHAGRWVIRGANLEPGQIVTVARRDGTTDRVVVDRVVSEADGQQLATFLRAA